MLINKFILKVCHFFGFRKDEEHITDVTINYPNDISNKDDALFDEKKISEEDVNKIKDYILNEFKKDPVLERRCFNAKQVWLTFYEYPEDTSSGSIMKMLYYDREAIFYQYPKDREAWKRHIKLKEVGI